MKLSGDLLKVLMNELGGQDFTTYLASLKDSDIAPFSSIKTHLLGDSKKESEFIDDITVFEDSVASIAVNSVWNTIFTEYKTANNLSKSLAGKKVESTYTVNGLVSGLTEELKKFMSDLDDIGLNVAVKEDKDVSYIVEYERVKDLYSKLHEENLVVEEVRQAADRIILHLDTLYKGLLGNNYVGILLPNGKVIPSSSEMYNKYTNFLEEKKTYLLGIASSWYSLTDIKKLAIDLPNAGLEKKVNGFDENGNKQEYDMLPFMHKKHLAMSLAEYNGEKEKIRKNIVDYLSRVKKEMPADYSIKVDELETGLTSCIILTEGNQHTLQLRASLLLDLDGITSDISQRLKDNIAGAEKLTILNTLINPKVKTIQNITVIYSMNKFEQEVLFAYKLYNGANAVSPDITKPILGIKLDGTLFRENLFSEKFTTILAGTRSGKGTLTQSLLAPLIASGQSLIYLDNKPDIASLFWDLEKKYKEKGKDVHFLAIDSLGQSSTFIKNEVSAAPRGRIVDEYGAIVNLNNIPDECPLDSNTLLLLRTYKTLQLLFLAGELQARGLVEGDNLTNYVFIDEITDLSTRLYNMYSQLGAVSKPKKDENIEKFEWAKKVCGVIKDVNNGFESMKTMVSDRHNFKFVLVGQVFNKVTKWPGDNNWVNKSVPELNIGRYNQHFIYRSMSMCRKWLSGRLQVTKDDYLLPKEDDYTMADKTGVFYYHTAKPNGPANLIGEQPPIKGGTLFRSYFALVRNDIGENIENIKEAIDTGTTDSYFNDYQDVGYTNKFLYNRNKDYGVADLKNSLNVMYDFENNQPIRGVGFGGLLEDIADLDNIDMYSDEMVKRLNAPYDRLLSILKTAGVMDELGYECLEDYLYDCSSDSFFTKVELETRYGRGHSNNGVYVPPAKGNEVIDYDSYNLTDDMIEELSDIDNKTQEQMDAVETEGRTLEEVEAEKQQIIIDAENLKLDAIKDNLLKTFATGFNARKGEVGDKIAKLLKSLYTYKQSPDAFNSAKESAMDSKITFIAKFDDLLEPLKEYPECVEFATGKINDFVNGKYVPIINLTYEDVLNKGKSGNNAGNNVGNNAGNNAGNNVGNNTGNNAGGSPFSQQRNGKQPIEDAAGKKPVNESNGQRIASPVDTEGLTYDLNDADSLGNAKVSSKLADKVVKDILKQFGGINNISEITLNATGCLIINGYTYTPQFGDNFVNSLGEVQKMELKQGKLTSVLNVGRVINGISLNIATLSIESPQIAYNDLFMNDLGIKKDYTSLFKSHPNLEDIYLPDEELHRHGNQQQGRSGLGLGAKLAGIFGMGRGNKDSGDYVPNPAPTYQAPPLIEKMWQSKPVRILTGALGWTLGCKAVVFAATVFGPWGLLFGALAAAGAYKEIKNEANQTRSTYNNNNRANNGNGGNNNGGNGNNRNRNSNNGGNNGSNNRR
jgi:hypothetical protein